MNGSDLHRAVLARDLDAVRACLDADPAAIETRAPDERAPEELGRGRADNTALHLAAFVGSEPIEALLCERGADPAAVNAEGRTALHVALEHDKRTCEKLLALGCPLDVCAATCLGRLEELETLLRESPELANDRTTGLSPLCWGAFYGAREAMEVLLAHGARMDDGELRCAVAVGDLDTARFLVERGADVGELWEDGSTALHVAAQHPYTRDAEPVARWLLERGADPGARLPDGRTPLDLAREREREQAERGVVPGDPAWCNYAGVARALAAER